MNECKDSSKPECNECEERYLCADEDVTVPIIPTCSEHRCTQESACWLVAPDGKKNPGGWLCKRHGLAIVEEYNSKLGEKWTLLRITEVKP